MAGFSLHALDPTPGYDLGSACLTISGAEPNGKLGSSMAAGDFDGDHEKDLAILAAGQQGFLQGKLFIFFGPLHCGEATHLGEISTGNSHSLYLGGEHVFYNDAAMAAGDLDRDGRDDIVLLANLRFPSTGKAFVIFGKSRDQWPSNGQSAARPGRLTDPENLALESPAPLSESGAVAIGDVNGDAAPDLLLGNPGDTRNTGKAYLFLGGPDFRSRTGGWIRADLIWTGETEGDRLGASLAAGGDIDGDNVGDVLLGAPGHSGNATVSGGGGGTGIGSQDGGTNPSAVSLPRAGSVYVIKGSLIKGSLIQGRNVTPGLTPPPVMPLGDPAIKRIDGTQADEGFGGVVVWAGHMNRDADSRPSADIAVSSPPAGIVRFLMGRPDIENIPSPVTSSNSIHGGTVSAYGSLLVPLGRLNQGAYDDMLIGAPLYDRSVNVGDRDSGKVEFVLGSAEGAIPQWSGGVLFSYGQRGGDRVGMAAAALGDLNGDGCGDFAVAAPFADGRQSPDGGKAHVMLSPCSEEEGSNRGGGRCPRWLLGDKCDCDVPDCVRSIDDLTKAKIENCLRTLSLSLQADGSLPEAGYADPVKIKKLEKCIQKDVFTPEVRNIVDHCCLESLDCPLTGRVPIAQVSEEQDGRFDGDGVLLCPAIDNCPLTDNADQADGDRDGFGDACDNCPARPNASQTDGDQDGWGDDCDNCSSKANPGQEDRDADGVANACDNCPAVSNPRVWVGDRPVISRITACTDLTKSKGGLGAFQQPDYDNDGRGDACDGDPDGDGVSTRLNPPLSLWFKKPLADNCPFDFNPGQQDADGDRIGDACDNCRSRSNADQRDLDCNGVGDVCGTRGGR